MVARRPGLAGVGYPGVRIPYNFCYSYNPIREYLLSTTDWYAWPYVSAVWGESRFGVKRQGGCDKTCEKTTSPPLPVT